MDIRVCEKKTAWDEYFLSLNRAEFLQSWEWGTFQDTVGHRPIRLQIYDNDCLLWQVQAFAYRPMPGITYAYIPRVQEPPSFNLDMAQIWDMVYSWFLQQRYTFIRIEPACSISSFPDACPRVATSCRQPTDTLFLHLLENEDVLLSRFHSKTRYNIRLAEKKGVVVRREKNAEIFLALHKQTTRRDQFRSHADEYYRKMLELPLCDQFIAYYQGVPIASNICVYSGDVYVYLHGASSNQARSVMAPYLLQWEQCLYAKKQGKTFYDFWGISPYTDTGHSHESFHTLSWNTHHSLSGVTRFKAGFGGDRLVYAQAVDVLLSPYAYRCFSFIKKVARIF